jgi:DNA invertase Pin-like site-specific DNA recombinase
MKIGYVRVSTREQNTIRQDELMKQLGVEKIYTDRVSGKNTDRPELQAMMDFVRAGDSITVESISRFARNTKDLLELMDRLKAKNVQFISQKEKLDTDIPSGKFMLVIFGAVAELERDYIRQRQREGIDLAMAAGKFTGRPQKELPDFEAVYAEWKAKKIKGVQACQMLHVARSTFYRRVKLYERDQETVDF